ncbi:ran-specific GTPase-activating protein-like [Orbicella faveolata]|uniref:ran-specific GTPase-activating protein-like n=1 Tax=Orbicella faveolata TaxID=48498 RepID=UPI0009E54CC7|nr:ran-specific GTPase-activating protein-like [Orbicella faveolata]
MSNEKVSEEAPVSPEIHFEPLVSLPKVDVKSLEEDEEALLKLRAKLYRFETSGEENEWKERGVGEVKILKHGDKGTHRILMRRDKTFKICANHYITKGMELKTNCGSDRAWVWTALDFADEEMKTETLAIRFANAENAKKFKDTFIKCQGELPTDETTDEQESNKLAKELEGLKVKESNDEEDKENKSENKDNETASKSSETEESETTKEDKSVESEDTPEK